jgi:hypothetical protein
MGVGNDQQSLNTSSISFMSTEEAKHRYQSAVGAIISAAILVLYIRSTEVSRSTPERHSGLLYHLSSCGTVLHITIAGLLRLGLD